MRDEAHVRAAADLLAANARPSRFLHVPTTSYGYSPGEQTTGAVLFVQKSADRKLSPVELVANTTKRLRPMPRAPFCSSTYVSIAATCPESCEFKGSGCYVTEGFTGRAARRLDAAALGLSADDVTALEAEAIHRAFFRRRIPQDGARGGRDLRLHVGGDVGSALGASMLGGAAMSWRMRGGGSVWTYTHAWRHVPREAWGPAVSVLASCETLEDTRAARAAGYAPALTLGQFPSDRAFRPKGGASLRIIPCPAETRGSTCVDCRLCIDRDLASMGVAIGFAVHGKGAEKARRRLPVIESALAGAPSPGQQLPLYAAAPAAESAATASADQSPAREVA